MKCPNCNRIIEDFTHNFCPSCGIKLEKAACPKCQTILEDLNQRFCPTCGYNLQKSSETVKYNTSESTMTYSNPEKSQVQKIKKDESLTISKRCFAFSLTSVLLAPISFITYGFLIYRFFIGGPRIISDQNIPIIVIVEIVNIIGLGLGIASKVTQRNIFNREPYNSYERAGGALGIIGIILNASGLLLMVYMYYRYILNASGSY